MEKKHDEAGSRRCFIKTAGRVALATSVGSLPFILARNTKAKGFVWQIDPYKCTACGICKTHCVLTPSAVKAVNAFPMCGYCDFCPGYIRQGAKTYDTAAENQLCPVGAIIRIFIEEPYFEYTVDEDLCDACGICVLECFNFGNGSLYLQIMHNLCVNCNECRIARNCPSNAISRVSENEPYIRKEFI